jgi:hypothetical protein
MNIIINGIGTRLTVNGVSAVEGDTIVFGAPRYLWPGNTLGCMTADPTTIWTPGATVGSAELLVQKEIAIVLPTWITTPYSWELFLEWRSQGIDNGNGGTGLSKWMVVPDTKQVGEGNVVSADYTDLTDTVAASTAQTTHSRSAAILLSDMAADFHLALVGKADGGYDDLQVGVSSDSRCWLSAV